MIIAIRAEGRKHPDAAVIDNSFIEFQRTPLRVGGQRKLQMQISVADVDEPILDRDVYPIGSTPNVIQITLAVLALGGSAGER